MSVVNLTIIASDMACRLVGANDGITLTEPLETKSTEIIII